MAYQTTTTGTGVPALGARVIFTLLGAAGMIIGAFLHWTRGMVGTTVGLRTLWTASMSTAPTFILSVGTLMIGLGLIAILSLSFGSGWLTRLAGAVGIVAVVLLAIETFRAAPSGSVELGAWVSAAGSLVVLIAGWFGSVRTTTTTSTEVMPPPPTDVVAR